MQKIGNKIRLIVNMHYSIIIHAYFGLVFAFSGGLGLEHEYFMRRALKEAGKALAKDETPVGAVIVRDGKVIAAGHNEKELKNDPTSHAEIAAIRKASKKLGSWRLNDCDMYVTLEPCTMCAGAIIQARLRRLYVGTADPKAGAAGSVLNILQVEEFNHKVEMTSGILEEECSAILKTFFRDLRERNKMLKQ
jgi:tRNA(adenine34) deaminase